MRILSILGRPGAGKGTQIKLLLEQTGFEAIKTGDLLRDRSKKGDAVGDKLRDILDNGLLVPTPIVFSLWMPKLEQIYNEGKVKGIIFDGNPRKLYEAMMLEELCLMFGWAKNFRACYINVHEEEAEKRLLERGRFDDNNKEIQERFSWFNNEVMEVVERYRKMGVLVEVNGTQPVEAVHRDIFGNLGSFLDDLN
ncbi:MAG: nucleoside monophosphate kinase [Candidatus Wildermuthbacteria bacterium]|nr:nucleoside monophosphate kinase [Candidatus Wildermuthbacteria bacterium]